MKHKNIERVKEKTVIQAISEGFAKNKGLVELLNKRVGLYGGYWLRSDLVKENDRYLLKVWTEFDENRYVVVDEDFPNNL